MQLPSTSGLVQVLLALPLLASASPISEKRAGETCHVQVHQRDVWHQDGLSRWRTKFSAEGAEPETFCGYWAGGHNVQCGYDAEVDGGSWRVDISYPLGVDGDNRFRSDLESNMRSWASDQQCTLNQDPPQLPPSPSDKPSDVIHFAR